MIVTGMILVYAIVEKYATKMHRSMRVMNPLLPLGSMFVVFFVAAMHMGLNFIDGLYFTVVSSTTVSKSSLRRFIIPWRDNFSDFFSNDFQ